MGKARMNESAALYATDTAKLLDAIRTEVAGMPATLLRSVYDYVLFLKSERAEEAYLWQKAQESEAYLREHPDEVTTMTAQDFDKLISSIDQQT